MAKRKRLQDGRAASATSTSRKRRNSNGSKRGSGDPKNHDSKGRFKPGNKAAVGNPVAQQAHRARWRALKALPDDAAENMINAMYLKALDGNMTAFQLLWDRVIGKPIAQDHREKVQIDAEGRELARQQHLLELQDKLTSKVKRRTTLTETIADQVAMLCSDGLPMDAAVDMVGVPSKQFMGWYEKGKALDETDAELEDEHDELCLYLVLAVRQAIGEYRLRLVQASANNRNAISLLERRDSRSFGRPDDQEQEDMLPDPDEMFI